MTEPTATITITRPECEILLDLLGHGGAEMDVAVAKLIKALYRNLIAYPEVVSTAPLANLPVVADEAMWMQLHRVFTKQGFGKGADEFRVKLANALRDIERREDLGEFEDEPTVPEPELLAFTYSETIEVFRILEDDDARGPSQDAG